MTALYASPSLGKLPGRPSPTAEPCFVHSASSRPPSAAWTAVVLFGCDKLVCSIVECSEAVDLTSLQGLSKLRSLRLNNLSSSTRDPFLPDVNCLLGSASPAPPASQSVIKTLLNACKKRGDRVEWDKFNQYGPGSAVSQVFWRYAREVKAKEQEKAEKV
ncbi:hypothetical protein JCM8097_004018 [Rhodosporidiobolus ruineniae]